MSEWKEYRYTDLCSLIGGGTPKTSEPTYWGGNIPWLSVKDFGNDEKYVYKTEKTITENGLNNSSTKLLQKDDIIISARGTIGAIAMLASEMAFNQSCFGIRSNELVEQQYLYYLTKTKITELQKNSHGSVFDTITRDTFSQIICYIPPIDTQRRIASILSSLDSKIAVNKKICENLEAQAQALFKHWFVDFAPFKDGKFVESELGPIPEGWRVGDLSEFCNIKYGKGLEKNKLSSEGYPVFGGNGIIGFYNKYLYELPQILVSCRGAASGKIIESYPHSYVTSNSLVLEMKDRSYYNYLKFNLLEMPLYMYATGSAQPQITIDNIKGVKIIFPELSVVQKVNPIFSVIGDNLWKNTQESSRLSTLRDTLLPKLMSGEIKVNEIEKSL